jgi:uncharacterized membrane-anchored protein
MLIPTRGPRTVTDAVRGPARTGRPTRALLPRLVSGDVAVIDHRDLDQATAQALVAAGVVAVVNAQPMSTGRYPNLGPQVLAEAGIVMVEGIGDSAFARLADEVTVVTIEDGLVRAGEQVIVQGHPLDADAVGESQTRAAEGLATQVESLAHNSAVLLRRESRLLLEGEGLPSLADLVGQRPVVVVGESRPCDLARLRSFVRQEKAVVIGVDGAVRRLRRARIKPAAVVVSDPASVEERHLRAAAKVVTVEPADSRSGVGHAVGRTGLAADVVASGASGDDIALLIAHRTQARVIVAAGLANTLSDYLDRQHPGLGGSFLARLVVGGRLVDAELVPLLHTGRIRPWHVVAGGVVGLSGLAVSIAATPIGQAWLDTLQAAYQ